MKVIVNKNRKMNISKDIGTQNENNTIDLSIEVPSQYKDFSKKIVFITDDGIVWDIIEDNKYKLKKAITKYKSVRFYIWLTKDDEDFRSEEKKLTFNSNTDINDKIEQEELDVINKLINEITDVKNKVNTLEVSEMEEVESVNKDEDFMIIVQDGINKKTKVKNVGTGGNITEAALLELVFPIGSTYITQTETNPNSILGFGTWERLRGKVCLGIDENDSDLDEIGKTGGEKEHTLATAEMPSHQHKMTLAKYGTDNASAIVWESGNNTGKYKYAGDMVEPVGGSQPHNNLQPYEIVGYMWIRRS